MNRVSAGKLAGLTTVPGSLFGPMWTGEFLVAVNQSGELGFARKEDMDGAALDRIVEGPQTVTEARMAMGVQLGTWRRLASILGPLAVKP